MSVDPTANTLGSTSVACWEVELVNGSELIRSSEASAGTAATSDTTTTANPRLSALNAPSPLGPCARQPTTDWMGAEGFEPPAGRSSPQIAVASFGRYS